MLASDLKVYRDTYRFVKMVENARKEYSKQFKYSLGEKTFNTAIDLFEYIQLANMFKDNRRKYLEGFIVKFETVKILLRLAEDFHQISINRRAEMFPIMRDIGRQITAWKNSSERTDEVQRQNRETYGDNGSSFPN